MIELSTLKPNEDNPRFINKEKFEKLKKSIQNFEKMLAIRPIIVDANNVILGGNMRYKALLDLGYKSVPKEWVKQVSDLTEEEKREFVIKDNNSFGQYDWEILANEWDVDLLNEWGTDVVFLEDDTEDEDTAEQQESKPLLKITFESPEQLQEAEGDIIELIDRKYQGATYSININQTPF